MNKPTFDEPYTYNPAHTLSSNGRRTHRVINQLVTNVWSHISVIHSPKWLVCLKHLYQLEMNNYSDDIYHKIMFYRTCIEMSCSHRQYRTVLYLASLSSDALHTLHAIYSPQYIYICSSRLGTNLRLSHLSLMTHTTVKFVLNIRYNAEIVLDKFDCILCH